GRIEDVAALVLDDHAHRVADAGEILAVVEVVADVRVRLRNRLLEAGVDLQLHGLESEEHRDRSAQQHHPQAVVEHQALEQVARARIEVFATNDHGHRVHFISSMRTPRAPTSARPPLPAGATPNKGIGLVLGSDSKLPPLSALSSTRPSWLTSARRPSPS